MKMKVEWANLGKRMKRGKFLLSASYKLFGAVCKL